VSALGTRRRRGNRGDLPLNAEINVTSLVDVAFTLLIIFIITAPILQGGIEVAVPQAEVQPLTAEDDPFYVTVTREGQIYVEETPMTAQEFEGAFPQYASAGSLERVYIRGDSLSDWGPVLKVIATVARSGVNFSVVGEPYGGR
jgi:biopolymer transport protein ExbD